MLFVRKVNRFMLKTKNFSQKSLTNEFLRQAQDDGGCHSDNCFPDGLWKNLKLI